MPHVSTRPFHFNFDKMQSFARVPMVGGWSGIHYEFVRDEPVAGVCGEGFLLHISRCSGGVFFGTMEEDATLCRSIVKGVLDGGYVKFSRCRPVFLVEHKRTIVSLDDFLIDVNSTIAKYQVIEPAFQYEGWYDSRLGEIRGQWFWPGFHCETKQRGRLQIGAMRGLWRMDFGRGCCR